MSIIKIPAPVTQPVFTSSYRFVLEKFITRALPRGYTSRYQTWIHPISRWKAVIEEVLRYQGIQKSLPETYNHTR